jgi:adenylate cyclase
MTVSHPDPNSAARLDAYTARFVAPEPHPSPAAPPSAKKATASARKLITVDYVDAGRVQASPDQTILEISRANAIDHVCVCGGQAKCSTCRVVVIDGLENCTPRTPGEARMAKLKGFGPELRLACQTRVTGPVRLRRLVLDKADMSSVIKARDEVTGRERDLAVLFADIRGFTAFAEANLAYDVVHILNRYFDLIGGAIDANHGFIDKYMGDGIMALFGLDDKRATHPCIDAVTAARTALAGLGDLNDYLCRYLGHRFSVAMGIHYGPTIVGQIGFSERRQFTAIGDTVNTAARLEGEAKHLGTTVVVSDTVFAHLPPADRQGAEPLMLDLRGKSELFAAHDISAPIGAPAASVCPD